MQSDNAWSHRLGAASITFTHQPSRMVAQARRRLYNIHAPTVTHGRTGTAWREMYKVFNCGHRLEIYLPAEHASGDAAFTNRL